MMGWPATQCARTAVLARLRQRRDGRAWTPPRNTTTRKPLLLLRLFGLFLLRTRAAALSTLLFHEPPRTTKPDRLTRCRANGAYHAAGEPQNAAAVGGFAPHTPHLRGQSAEPQSQS
jgi:hypothetical protein